MKIFKWSISFIFFSVVGISVVHGDIKNKTLDQYLHSNGFNLSPAHSDKNEGYMTQAQQKQFIDRLKSKKYQSVASVLEIGLNAGHSAETFLQNGKNIGRFVSVDINHHSYTKHAVEYLKQKYLKIFIFIEGDSKQAIPKLFNKARKQPFDLIYIDGDHRYDGCLTDILNCKKLAQKNTFVWIDDCEGNDVEKVVNDLVKKDVLKLIKIHVSENQHGRRVWAEAQYIFGKQESNSKISKDNKTR